MPTKFSSLFFVLVVAFLQQDFAKSDDDLQKSWEYMKQSFASLGDFFSTKVKDFKDLWSDNYENLREKVNDTVKYLEKCKENAAKIIADAKAKGNKELEDAAGKIDAQLREAKEFQKQLTDSAKSNYNNLKKNWETKTQNWWNNGMDKLSAFSQSLKKGSAMVVASVSIVLVTLSATLLV